MTIQHILRTSISALALLLFGSTTALAGTLGLQFGLDTNSIEAMGTFYLAFQLVDGSGTGDANNTVTLSGFNFDGGSVAGVPTLYGGASGSLSSGVTLTDSDPFFNAMWQDFVPGPWVTFYATFTNNADSGPFQDMFMMSILDGSQNGIPTVDPSGNNTFLTVTLNGTVQSPAPGVLAPPLGVWGADPQQTSYNMSAPEVVPEPGSLMLLGSALAGLGLWRRRRRH
jgi:hypothetical protein